MLTSDDVQQLKDRRTTYLRRESRKSWRVILATILTSLILFAVWIVFSPTPGAVYTLTDDGWIPFDAPNGIPERLEISESGDIWMATAHPNRLHRYNGTTWTTFKLSDYGVADDAPIHFSLSGNDVWVAIQDSVVHFDGATWETYRDVLPGGRLTEVIDIATSSTDVVVADNEGNIAHFDGQNWQRQFLTDALPDVSYIAEDEDPLLLRLFVVDDQILLNFRRVNVLNSEGRWEHFTVSRMWTQSPILAITSQDIWSTQRNQLVRYELYASDGVARYLISSVGFETTSEVNAWAVGNTLWTGSKSLNTVRRIVNNTWTQMPDLPQEQFVLTGVVQTPDGTIFASAENPLLLWQMLHFVTRYLFLASVPVVILLVSAYAGSSKKKLRARYVEAWQKSVDVMPKLDHQISIIPKGEKLTFGGIISGIATIFLIAAYLQHLIGYWFFPIMIVLFTFLLIGERILYAQDKAYSKQQKQMIYSGALVATVVIMLWFSLCGLYVASIESAVGTLPLLPFIILNIVAVVTMFIYAVLLNYFLFLLPIIVIARFAVAKGDYAKAKRWIDSFSRWFPLNLNLPYRKAHIEYLSGNLQEAREAYINIAPGIGTAQHLATLLLLLSAVEQNEQKMLQLLQVAIEIAPEQNVSYYELVAYYHEKNILPDVAAQIYDEILVVAPRKPRFMRLSLNYFWHFHQLLKAETLANIGKFTEANAIVETVFDGYQEYMASSDASLYKIAGRIKRAQGDRPAAIAYFQRAIDRDSNGYMGNEAKRNMNAMLAETE